MALYLIGTGLCTHKDITFAAKEAIDVCDVVYLENYTSKLQGNVDELFTFLTKNVVVVDRQFIEQQTNTILSSAKTGNVAVLVVGDVFSATTHIDLYMSAKKSGVDVQVFFNASVLTAVGIVGLELYKYGKTTSMPFFTTSYKPKTPYDVIVMNKKNGLHTLVLLDIQADVDRYMDVRTGLEQLRELESLHKEGVCTDDALVVGCARLGCNDMDIVAGRLVDVLAHDFGAPLHCLVVPGSLHFIEEEALSMWGKLFKKKD